MFDIKYCLNTLGRASLIGTILLSGINLSQPSAVALTQTKQTQKMLNAYFTGGYGYCDAQMLGAFWQTTPESAKLIAGKGLLGYRGFARDIPSKLSAARQQYAGRGVCNYSSDFSYEDAVALAAYWKTSISDAKASLTSKLESGNLPLAKQVVKTANQAFKQSSSSSNETFNYRLKTMFTGANKCLDIVNDGRNDRVTMADCGNFSGQYWKMATSDRHPGYTRLQTMFIGANKCLDIVNDGRNDRVTMADCGDFSGQYWKMVTSDRHPGYTRLQTIFTGTNKCLDIVNDGKNDRVTMANCGDFSGQYWKVNKAR